MSSVSTQSPPKVTWWHSTLFLEIFLFMISFALGVWYIFVAYAPGYISEYLPPEAPANATTILNDFVFAILWLVVIYFTWKRSKRVFLASTIYALVVLILVSFDFVYVKSLDSAPDFATFLWYPVSILMIIFSLVSYGSLPGRLRSDNLSVSGSVSSQGQYRATWWQASFFLQIFSFMIYFALAIWYIIVATASGYISEYLPPEIEANAANILAGFISAIIYAAVAYLSWKKMKLGLLASITYNLVLLIAVSISFLVKPSVQSAPAFSDFIWYPVSVLTIIFSVMAYRPLRKAA